jgi:hypothetical protein
MYRISELFYLDKRFSIQTLTNLISTIISTIGWIIIFLPYKIVRILESQNFDVY